MQITRDSVTQWLTKYLSRKLDFPEDGITAGTMLADDLGMDELDILELPGEIGDEFDLFVPPCSECCTVGDVVDLVMTTAGRKHSDIADAADMAVEHIVPTEEKPELFVRCAFCNGGVPLRYAGENVFPVCDSCRKILTDIIAERKGKPE